MSLPSWLRPWWPVLKRVHRFLSFALGVLFRLVSPLLGARGVPTRATATARETAQREPGAVTWHPGRDEEPLVRPRTQGLPERHWLFEAVHEARETTAIVPAVTVPATFVLDVAGGRLTGDYAATTTPGKILDHETSTYFGVSDWREHPLFLHPTLGDVEQVDGTVLSLSTRGTSINYYHFLYDAIGRLAVLEEALGTNVAGLSPDAIVVPHQAGYQRQLLELAGVTGRLIQPERGRTVAARRLIVPSNPNWALQAPPSTVQWLRAHLPPTPGADGPRRLYLTRGDQPRTRRYVEEAALWPELERRGFVRIDPGKHPVQEQIDLFHGADVVVAPHGAGLTNLTFARPGVRVLEMFASTYVHLGLWSICQAIDADYRYLVGDGPQGSPRRNSGVLDDVSVAPERVLDLVDELLGGARP